MLKRMILGVSSLVVGATFGLSTDVSAAPAPPLTSLNVVKVEFIGPNNLSTVKDHGGSYLYIYTNEMGYGRNPIAQMSGQKLKKVDSKMIDINGDRTVDGWEYKWDASGQQNGQFKYQNTSTNAPWNTLSPSLNIK
ncbi:DUF4879 domain-containing protein [Bacillus cereus]